MPQLRVRGAAAVATAWIVAVACSVFPDHAVLPTEMGGASGESSGGALGGMLPTAGNASGNDAGRSGASESDAGYGAESALGGAPGNSQAGAGSGGLALAGRSGSTATDAGATGVAGGGGCAASHVVVAPIADAWIDAGDAKANHGSDAELVVLAGTSERRALLLFDVPATKVGEVLVSAELVLTLSTAPALGASTRNLSVHLLTQTFSENRVSWTNYSNGASHTWLAAGADFAANFDTGTLRAGDAALRVDVSARIDASQATKVGFLVRDAAGTTLPALSFSFASREEGGARSPVLDLEYCTK